MTVYYRYAGFSFLFIVIGYVTVNRPVQVVHKLKTCNSAELVTTK